jgi:hypothetical protein
MRRCAGGKLAYTCAAGGVGTYPKAAASHMTLCLVAFSCLPLMTYCPRTRPPPTLLPVLQASAPSVVAVSCPPAAVAAAPTSVADDSSSLASLAQATAALEREKRQLELTRINTAASGHCVVQQLVLLRSLHYQQLKISLRTQSQLTRPGSLDLQHDPSVERDALRILTSPEVSALYKRLVGLLQPCLA